MMRSKKRSKTFLAECEFVLHSLIKSLDSYTCQTVMDISLIDSVCKQKLTNTSSFDISALSGTKEVLKCLKDPTKDI